MLSQHPLVISLKHSKPIIRAAKFVLGLQNGNLERVVFTATTGRTGTLTLANLMKTIPGCQSVHEPYPIMNEEVLRASNEGNIAAVDQMYGVKSVNILRASAGYRYYLEANHLFVKTFIGQAVRDFGERLAVIHLVRSPIDVAMSLFTLDQVPGTPIADVWWLDHRAPSNVIQMASLLDGESEWSHPYFKALWYWYEVEMRFARFRALFPQMAVVRFETEWLNRREEVYGLLDRLGMAYSKSAVARAIGRREHLMSELKVRSLIPRADAEAMAARFQLLLRELRVDVDAVRFSPKYKTAESVS